MELPQEKDIGSQLRVAVVGAGISGLASAYHLLRTAQRLQQGIKVVIFEQLDCPGGTWSTANVYPGLVTNNTWDQMLFDDQGLSECERMFEEDPEASGGLGALRASGEGMIRVMTRLEQQVVQLGAEIRYSTSVVNCQQPRPKRWRITSAPVIRPLDGMTEDYDKLIVATGTFSVPSVPSFAETYMQPRWTPVLDHRGLLTIHTSHLSDSSVQKALYARPRRIAIIGGSKSALDAAERLASAGQQVSLILRNPPYTAAPFGGIAQGKYLSFVAMVGSRFKLANVPYFRDPVSGTYSTGGFFSSFYRWFLHFTRIGSKYCDRLFRITTAMYNRFNQWSKPLSDIMLPTIPLKWSESSIYPGPINFASLIQEGKVKIIRGGLTGMREADSGSDSTSRYALNVDLTDARGKQELLVDCVIFATGWKTGDYPFFTRDLADELGLPVPYSEGKPPLREDDFTETDTWAANKVEKEIFTMRDVPKLWQQAGYSARSVGRVARSVAPYRLYRLLVPVSHLYQHDVVFPGVPTSKANHVVFMVQSHWVADYLLGLLPKLPNIEKAREEISMQVQWSRKLFGPAHGGLGQWLGGGWIEYAGRLCWDMNVQDVKGLKTIVISKSYNLESKRAQRDHKLGLGIPFEKS